MGRLSLVRSCGTGYLSGVKRQRLIAAADLAEGQTVKFEFTREGIDRDGFVARFQGKFVAYENVCRHLPLSHSAEFDWKSGSIPHCACYEP